MFSKIFYRNPVTKTRLEGKADTHNKEHKIHKETKVNDSTPQKSWEHETAASVG